MSGTTPTTASAEPRSTPTQPGPLSIHAMSSTAASVMPSARTMRALRSASTGPERRRGGAANPSRGERRTSTSPAPHSCTTTSPRGTPPASSHAWALPMVGWPGERQLAGGRPDPHPVVGGRVGRRAQERGLGQVGPPCEARHLLVGEAVGVVDDRERVAEPRLGAEDIDLAEGQHPAIQAQRRAGWGQAWAAHLRAASSAAAATRAASSGRSGTGNETYAPRPPATGRP